MTVELGSAAPNVTSYLLAWLLPLAGHTDNLGAKRWQAKMPLPYRLVNRISGADDAYAFADAPVVSVHTFGHDYDEAAREADLTHRRMRVLIDDPTTEVSVGGQIVTAEYVETVEGPLRVDYGDANIERFVARYRVSLHFV